MYPLVLDPSGRRQFFEKKPPFDPTVYLKHPFVIMIGVTLLLSCMMKNVDPEELKKAQAEQPEIAEQMPEQCKQ